MSPARASQEIYRLLKNGAKVSYQVDGMEKTENVQIIDWSTPKNNDYFLASQLWVTGELYKRRADLVGFVNGIPLLFIELKAAHRRLENAFQDNLRDYKNTIPQLFWYNAFITSLFQPCPCSLEMHVYINAKLLGLYISEPSQKSSYIVSFHLS
ncbi:MAG: type restriction enzyme subunit [Euryarchaeota archaeon]|nr:type restriction enzyme subunit [Euryarchaeota archaeon]